MSNFNWQTEEDVSWDDLEPVAVTAVARRRSWVTYVLIMVGVITAVALIYRQVNQRIEVATANATSDVLASHNLVQQAVTDQDTELFNTLLSGRDFAWVDAQSELVQSGSLFDRSALDMPWLPPPDTAVTQADVEKGQIDVEINPELNAVELTFLQAYAIAVGNGVTETVQLKQTAVYRLGTQRWLYAPPDDTFWGEFESVTGSMVTLAFPARDAELAKRLAFDLDAKLAEMCQTVADLNCPDDFHLHLRLDIASQSLINTARPTHAFRNGLRVNLPAPTLVGLPVDEAGYQALYRGYAIHLVSAAVAELTGYECCIRVAYFQALLDYQLELLGLRPLRSDRVDYERVVRENIGVEELDAIWRSDDDLSGEAGWLAVTAVDFIRQELPNAAIASLQRHMNNQRRLVDWLTIIASESAVTIDDASAMMLSRRWQPFAFEQYQANQPPPPLPLPEQTLYLLCMPSQGEAASELYQYQLADLVWIQHPLDIPALSLSPLLDDSAILFQDFGGELPRTALWHEERIEPLFEENSITFGQFDPTGQYLLVYRLDQEALAINQVDWAACMAGECVLEVLGGNPVWSPLGTDFIMLPAESLGQEPFEMNGRTILFDPASSPFEWPLYRGDGQPPTNNLDELTRFGTGFAPFWLDESTFGYIRQIRISSNNDRRELVLINKADDLPRSILTEGDMQRGLPDDLMGVPLSLRYAIPHPQQPQQLFIAATAENREMVIVSYDIQTDDIEFRLKAGLDGEHHTFSFSPDGRYLVVTSAVNRPQVFEDHYNNIYLVDLETNQSQTFAGTPLAFAPSNSYDWSADGQWLVIAQENQTLTLTAPAYDYQQFIAHDLEGCTNVAWLNQ